MSKGMLALIILAGWTFISFKSFIGIGPIFETGDQARTAVAALIFIGFGGLGLHYLIYGFSKNNEDK